ncbi:hypothetical protein G7Y89_g10360 [Cudoniella acicularis]|uniref:Xylanolytic transcriptional activator regulatory domain-containing protein n=1 Tax=Cudoniella acicularis TaxID=354080 RepID=A0A8H4VYU7_9HELO|nr:hypothetical protein G7Y89_g10360 [Cudoniella acicularis]
MEITFVPQQAGDSAKRKRFNKACETCRRRKKRCIHVGVDDLLDQSNTNVHGRVSAKPPSAQAQEYGRVCSPSNSSSQLTRASQGPSFESANSHAAQVTALTSPSLLPPQATNSSPKTQDTPRFNIPKRFVGDLNPEAVFLDGPMVNNQPAPLRDGVGVWLEKGDWDAVFRDKESTPNLAQDSLITSTNIETPLVDVGTHNPSNSTSLNVLAVSDQAALIAIYFSRIHPLLPLIDENEFREGLRSSDISECLVQAVCLVAAKDTRSKPHLCLRPGMPVLKPRDFSKTIYTSLFKAVQSGFSCDKITTIRILTLMSLHIEGPDGAEEASLHLSQAIHHAQTIGLHLGRATNSRGGESHKKLFWCLWGLDKLNAAINGRPVMISDSDLGIQNFTSKSPNDKPFEVWLKLARMLSQVIALYRPSALPSVTGWEEDFPGFEEIVDQYDAWSLNLSALTTLHVFYLVVAILSSRSKSTKDSTPATASFVRQSLSAIHVTTLMSGKPTPDIFPLPLIPYGVSLALSVAYKKMRQSRLNHQQEQAKIEFRACCETLEVLKQTWWSAEIMAGLAHRVLIEVDKISNPLDLHVNSRRQSLGNIHAENGPPSPRSPTNDTRRDGNILNINNNPNATLAHSDGQSSHAQSAQIQANFQQPTMPDQFETSQFDIQTRFDDIDNIFGAYLDPNFPINYDDFLGTDNLQFGWNGNWNAGL